MTDRLAHVYTDLDGTTHPVGRLFAHKNRGKETASFEYEKEWLPNPLRARIGPFSRRGPFSHVAQAVWLAW